MPKPKIKCLICDAEYSERYLGHHVSENHNISPENYFLNFLKNEKKKCPVCQNTPRFHSIPIGYRQYCTGKCLRVALQTDPALREKNLKNTKSSVQKKYGVDNVFSTDWCKNKTKSSLIEKYGVDSPIKNQVIKDKIKKTNLMRYGVENPFQSDDIIKNKILPKKNYADIVKKSKNSCLNKYGVSNILKLKSVIDDNKKFIREKMISAIFDGDRLNSEVIPLFTKENYISVNSTYLWKCVLCQTEFKSNLDDGKIPKCTTCYPKPTDSAGEIEILNFIKEIDPLLETVHKNRTLLNGKELDIYIPSLKLAIEYDGLYWHSEISGGKSKDYHLNKTLECEKLGIRLIHIFEDEWKFKKDIVKSKIRSILNKTTKIYARNCIIKTIPAAVCGNFLIENHIHGKDNSKIKIGLFYNDELISVMTFGCLRKCLGNKTKDGSYEMYRFCNKQNITVIGGASKLLSYFTKTYNPNSIISYADRRWSVGNLYEKLNFSLISKTKSGYFYTRDHNIKFHRYNFRKDKLKSKLNIFDPSLTEWKNMQINGYDRIWDCGCLKYERIIQRI